MIDNPPINCRKYKGPFLLSHIETYTVLKNQFVDGTCMYFHNVVIIEFDYCTLIFTHAIPFDKQVI